jgi:hypothetical protein
MKKLILILVSFLSGVAISILYLSNLTTFNFGSSKSLNNEGTRRISLEDHKVFKSNFDEILKNAPTLPSNQNTKLIGWPDTLSGWVVDANLIEEFILNQGSAKRDSSVNNIYLELGYNKNANGLTIMLTGLEEIISNEGNSIKRYKKINRTATNTESDLSNILEYVNPCRPHCPE